LRELSGVIPELSSGANPLASRFIQAPARLRRSFRNLKVKQTLKPQETDTNETKATNHGYTNRREDKSRDDDRSREDESRNR